LQKERIKMAYIHESRFLAVLSAGAVAALILTGLLWQVGANSAWGAVPDDQGAKPQVDLSLTRARFYKLSIDPRTNQPVVELLNEESTRILRIWIGFNEAIAIEMETRKIEPLRPMTHDLIVNIIKGLGAKVNQVVIHDLRASTYYAYISLSLGDRNYTVDSRPSDAIALSLRVNAPIYVATRIFSDYGIEASRTVAADELKDMLGVDVQNLTQELVQSFGLKSTDGVLVAGVDPDGKAAAGGLKRGDVILEVGGELVADMSALAARIKAMVDKGLVRIKVHREGKELELTLRP
jgi:bifunctional DNase/RNase